MLHIIPSTRCCVISTLRLFNHLGKQHLVHNRGFNAENTDMVAFSDFNYFIVLIKVREYYNVRPVQYSDKIVSWNYNSTKVSLSSAKRSQNGNGDVFKA